MKSKSILRVVCGLFVALVMVSNGTSTAAPRKLVNTFPAFGDVDTVFRIGPQGTWVVYCADQDQDEVFELYCVDLAGGASSKLNVPLGNGGDVGMWQLSADGERAIYWANVSGTMQEVFSASTVGGDGVQLNSPLVGPGSIAGGVAGERAVYIASERQSVFFDPHFELFSVPVAGGSVELLSGPLVSSGDVKAVVTRANSARVLYLADQQTDEMVELYSVSALGGSWTKLNPTLVINGNVLSAGLALSPDGNRAIYVADQEKDERFELFSVPAGGGTAVKLNGPLVNGGNVTPGSQQFNANGSRVLYHADQNSDEVFEIFSVASAGAA